MNIISGLIYFWKSDWICHILQQQQCREDVLMLVLWLVTVSETSLDIIVTSINREKHYLISFASWIGSSDR
jgi:hypothetical protein